MRGVFWKMGVCLLGEEGLITYTNKKGAKASDASISTTFSRCLSCFLKKCHHHLSHLYLPKAGITNKFKDVGVFF